MKHNIIPLLPFNTVKIRCVGSTFTLAAQPEHIGCHYIGSTVYWRS